MQEGCPVSANVLEPEPGVVIHRHQLAVGHPLVGSEIVDL